MKKTNKKFIRGNLNDLLLWWDNDFAPSVKPCLMVTVQYTGTGYLVEWIEHNPE